MNGDGLKDIVTGKRFWAHGTHGDPEPMRHAGPLLVRAEARGRQGEVHRRT